MVIATPTFQIQSVLLCVEETSEGMPSFDISLDNIATDILHADLVLKCLMQQRQNIYQAAKT